MGAITTPRHGLRIKLTLQNGSIVERGSIERMPFSSNCLDSSGVRMHGKTMSELGVSGSTDLARWNNLKSSRTIKNITSNEMQVVNGGIALNGIEEYLTNGIFEFIDLGGSQSAIYLNSSSPATYDTASGTQVGQSTTLVYGTYFYRCLVWTATSGYLKSEWVYSKSYCFDDFDLIDVFQFPNVNSRQYLYYDKSTGVYKSTVNGTTLSTHVTGGTPFLTSADFDIIRGVGFPKSSVTGQLTSGNQANKISATVSSANVHGIIAFSLNRMPSETNGFFQFAREDAAGTYYHLLGSQGATSLVLTRNGGGTVATFNSLGDGNTLNMSTPDGAVVILYYKKINGANKPIRCYYGNSDSFNVLTSFQEVNYAFGAGTGAMNLGIPESWYPGSNRIHELVALNLATGFEVTDELINQLYRSMFNKIK